MIAYTDRVVELLNPYFLEGNQYVESVLLSSYGLKIQFVSFDIQCNERVSALISGTRYEWNDAPNPGPWGALVRQKAMRSTLKSPFSLSITLESGDSIEIETVEGQHESVIIQFPPREGSVVMEIF